MTSTEDRNLIGVTGKNSILHLIFTNDAENFKDYWPIIMAPISYHNRITFNIYDTSGEHKHVKNNDWPEVLKYNVSNGGLVKMRTELKLQTAIKFSGVNKVLKILIKISQRRWSMLPKKLAFFIPDKEELQNMKPSLSNQIINWWHLKHREKSDLLELQIGQRKS